MTKQEEQTAPSVSYKDDDLVYVDPRKREVVGLVEFTKSDIPKPLEMKHEVVEEEEDDTKGNKRPKRVRKKQYYPWGTYRSMKKVYKIEGKIHEPPPSATLDDVMKKALVEPYWD